ncbi:MAG TPA: Spy/CpxP family protein refolding chaperone [Thermoanaerobaculia bacterium]|jgi:Spy/CpxP family protein refolding chaperone|nr:Spy/CpxP family protein refolding chaperone [Thermoanaerobaculia bacterium]
MKRFATLLCLLTLAAVPAFAGGHHAAGTTPDAAANPAGHMGDHLAHLAKALDLTDAQKAAAKPLQDELQAAITPLFADLETKHQALRAALDANADATTVGEAAIAAHAVELQIKATHDKFATAFAGLLTPDQLTKFNTLKAQHEKHGDFRHPGH